MDLLPVPGERIEIPYEDTTLPGISSARRTRSRASPVRWWCSTTAATARPRGMGLFGGAAAAERGYHWMTFDGPGQQAALFLQNIPFRHDWEAVLTPVVDAMVARPDVDAERVAVIGVSQAGYWVPRALAFEHRFAAAVADPGVVDVSTSWTSSSRSMNAQRSTPGKRRRSTARWGGRAVLGRPAATLHSAASPTASRATRGSTSTRGAQYKLGDEVKQHHHAAADHRTRGRAVLARPVPAALRHAAGDKELVEFAAAEGANRHCEPMGLALRDARMFDWLDSYLSE